MANAKLLNTIRECTKEVFGEDVYVPYPQSAKLKSGTRVFRISGHCPGYRGALFEKDGKIWVTNKSRWDKDKPGPFEIEVPDAGEHDDLPDYSKYEWVILKRRADVIEKELQEAIDRRVPNIKVQVGPGDTNNGYPTSMSFTLNEPIKPPRKEDVFALLFNALPPVGSVWEPHERKRWLETAERMFELAYAKRLV